MTINKALLPTLILALAFAAGAFLFPASAFAAAAADTKPPTVTAVLSEGTLKVEAKDDTAVAAVYIDGHRVNTLVNGAASVKLKDYAGNGKQVMIYAADTAGNRSESVLLDNPYYKAPAELPAPGTQTASHTAPKAETSTSASANAATPSASTPAPAASTSASSVPEPQMPAVTTGSAAGGSTSAIPNGPDALTPSGSGTLQDSATDKDGKEFYTVTATDGSVYYLIVDRQRGAENVYFLSAVTKDDLSGLAQDEGAGIPPDTVQPEPEESGVPGADDQEAPKKQKKPAGSGGSKGTLIFILIAAAVCGGAGYWFKIVRPRKQAAHTDEEDFTDEDDEPEEDEDSPDNEEYFFEEDQTDE
jgi:hypothetical protein